MFDRPPENELQKVGERVPSEHELRVQRSLQRLNVPDWYKNSPVARDGAAAAGFRLKRHSDASQHGGWRALGSKTTSLSSLSSSSNRQPTAAPSPRLSSNKITIDPNQRRFINASQFYRCILYIGTLLSPSPTPPVFSRWSTSLLNSAGSSPASSARSSFNHRQPYLGWRSQERLANPRTPAERLAQGILPQLQNANKQGTAQSSSSNVTGQQQHQPGTQSTNQEVRNSIKEVTSAIVHYVQSGQEAASGRLSPRTAAQMHQQQRQDYYWDDGRQGARSTSPRAATHQRTQSTDSRMTTYQQQQQQQQQIVRSRPPLQRRRSEGNEPTPPLPPPHQNRPHHHHPPPQPPPRRTSLDSIGSFDNVALLHHQQQLRLQQQQQHLQSNPSSNINNNNNNEDRVVRCRNSKCQNQASLAEARKTYKSCHNCTCLYCSRECRRAHWHRHKRTCLYSRANSLCIQVLSSIKKDPQSLKHLSTMARRGYLAQGRGAVKCFFASPEAAEKFVQSGFQELGEPAYVKWSDVLPSEMGAELYAEACKLCESYNAETRSQVPSASGAVMWERQPVSRCAKLKLEASCRAQTTTSSASTSAVASPQPQPQQKPKMQSAPPPPPIQQQPQPANITRDMDSPETLVLTSRPLQAGGPPARRSRELAFENIQRLLRQRGVSLRRHFPQVHGKLGAYVEASAADKFAPVTIYPRDQASGRSFMCIIMLEAEPERLRLLPTDSSRVKTVDVCLEHEIE
ncbi:unnamed protein product [Trichogramma brassicae]|uniref:Apical junction molecule ajm1 alpha/beta domain-containing protein n=1 Tax=Trichogramma brassicae TaxID=86971 RepID=A0A6H5IB66_9HYME|nr:unnamed protein product [Trichogramma brassicae]